MSAPGNDKILAEHQEYYPPPPPGPPPGHTSTAAPAAPGAPIHPTSKPAVAQHSNETPISDYNIPAYHPSQAPPGQYYPPPDASELYDDDSPAHHHHEDGSAASKSSWSQRFSGLASKAAVPFNALANKMGSEAFLPTTMDKECEKAARILRGFCSRSPVSLCTA